MLGPYSNLCNCALSGSGGGGSCNGLVVGFLFAKNAFAD